MKSVELKILDKGHVQSNQYLDIDSVADFICEAIDCYVSGGKKPFCKIYCGDQMQFISDVYKFFKSLRKEDKT